MTIQRSSPLLCDHPFSPLPKKEELLKRASRRKCSTPRRSSLTVLIARAVSLFPSCPKTTPSYTLCMPPEPPCRPIQSSLYHNGEVIPDQDHAPFAFIEDVSESIEEEGHIETSQERDERDVSLCLKEEEHVLYGDEPDACVQCHTLFGTGDAFTSATVAKGAPFYFFHCPYCVRHPRDTCQPCQMENLARGYLLPGQPFFCGVCEQTTPRSSRSPEETPSALILRDLLSQPTRLYLVNMPRALLALHRPPSIDFMNRVIRLWANDVFHTEWAYFDLTFYERPLTDDDTQEDALPVLADTFRLCPEKHADGFLEHIEYTGIESGAFPTSYKMDADTFSWYLEHRIFTHGGTISFKGYRHAFAEPHLYEWEVYTDGSIVERAIDAFTPRSCAIEWEECASLDAFRPQSI